MKQDYDGKLQKLLKHANNVHFQFTKFKVLNEGIFEDITLRNLIEKLIKVAEPQELWDEINNLYPGYFIKCIQKQYGIVEQHSSKLLEDF